MKMQLTKQLKESQILSSIKFKVILLFIIGILLISSILRYISLYYTN